MCLFTQVCSQNSQSHIKEQIFLAKRNNVSARAKHYKLYMSFLDPLFTDMTSENINNRPDGADMLRRIREGILCSMIMLYGEHNVNNFKLVDYDQCEKSFNVMKIMVGQIDDINYPYTRRWRVKDLPPDTYMPNIKSFDRILVDLLYKNQPFILNKTNSPIQ